jgi:hypothetical protein
MNNPEVRQRISERTQTALADPATRERQRIGLIAAWADDEKRKRHAALTRECMARWRAARLEAAAVVLQQLPKADRERALATLNAAPGTKTKKERTPAHG